MSHDNSNHVTPSRSGQPVEPELAEFLEAIGFQQREITGMPEGVTMFTANPPTPEGWEGFEVVSTYSRAEAIDDGVLTDLTADGETKLLAHEAGFKIPVAMTTTAFHATVLAGTTENESGEFIFPPGQSTKGRLWDVLRVLRHAIRALPPNDDRVFFKVDVDVHGDGKHGTVSLWALVGPGDTAAPVLTIMLQGED